MSRSRARFQDRAHLDSQPQMPTATVSPFDPALLNEEDLCPASHLLGLLYSQVVLTRIAELVPRQWAKAETTFWTWLIPADLMPLPLEQAPEFRSIRQHSNALCAQSASLEPIIFAHIYARIRTSVPSFAQCAEKLLQDSTIANVTKVCTVARRSSSAKASSVPRLANTGAVVDVLPEPMPWVAISEAKPVGYASSPSSRKRRQTVSTEP